MDPTLLNNLLASLRNTIFNVLTQNGTPFQQLGQNIFRTVAIVMIVIAGTRIAFSDHHSLHKLRTLAGLILLVWIMITLYSTPSPLLGGYSFSEVVPRTAFAMADLVGTTTQQQMLAKLNDIMNGIQSMSEFSLLHARDFITYLLITGEIFGWTDFLYCDREAKANPAKAESKYNVRPDLTALDPHGRKVAIECELSLKNPARYRDNIIPGHIRRLNSDEYDYVLWITKTLEDQQTLHQSLTTRIQDLMREERLHLYRNFTDYKMFQFANLETWLKPQLVVMPNEGKH
jgi:hypothetical protein